MQVKLLNCDCNFKFVLFVQDLNSNNISYEYAEQAYFLNRIFRITRGEICFQLIPFNTRKWILEGFAVMHAQAKIDRECVKEMVRNYWFKLDLVAELHVLASRLLVEELKEKSKIAGKCLMLEIEILEYDKKRYYE